jgi:hypothetical protein
LKHPLPFWGAIAPALAEDYLRRAKRGLMTAAEIEAELEEKNLPPLSVTPDPKKFDPMAEVWWTLGMAAAWVIWRTPQAVRDVWWNYRREVRRWAGPHNMIIPAEEQASYGYRTPHIENVIPGYTLMSWPELHLSDVLLRSSWDLPEFGVAVVAGEAARMELWRKLESGELVAEGICIGGGARAPIRDADWIDLDQYCQNSWPADSIGSQGEESPRYLSVRVRRARAVELWPAQHIRPAVAEPTSQIKQHDRREAIRHAFMALWPDGAPLGLMVKQRDTRIQEWFKAKGLQPPSSRTISRALSEP